MWTPTIPGAESRRVDSALWPFTVKKITMKHKLVNLVLSSEWACS